MALSRGVPPRPQAFAAQADAQPFAALLDAAVAPVPDRGAGSPNSQKPPADTGAADTAVAAQDRAAGSASAPSGGSAAHGSAAPANGAPAQSAGADGPQGAAADKADDGKPGPASGVNGSATSGLATSANGTSIQTAHADGTHQTTAKSGGDHKPGPGIVLPPPVPSVGGNSTNPPSGTSADATSNAKVPSGNDPPAPDATDSGKDAPNSTSAAAVAAAIVDLSGSAPANGATPVATKPAADGKDDDKDQDGGSADAATVLSAASQAQLPSPDAVQPVAAAVVVNAAPDPAPAVAAKPGLTIADAAKSRVKVTAAPGATEQTILAQGGTDDAPGSSSAVASGSSNIAPAGPNDATADGSASSLQQAIDQAPAPGANGVSLLSQIDFASQGGTEHFVLRGDTATSSNGAAGSAAPNGAANAAMVPNFGIFGPGAIAANSAAPAAAAPDATVPLAGLAVAIAGRAQAGASQFDIRLDPPELGRIDVRLDVDGSGQVRTHVTVDRADTLQLLQSQQPQLERALEQAGLKTAENGLQFTLRDQSFAGQNSGSGGQQYANHQAAPLVIPDIDAAPIDTAQIYARLRLGNGLDISV